MYIQNESVRGILITEKCFFLISTDIIMNMDKCLISIVCAIVSVKVKKTKTVLFDDQIKRIV